MAVRSCPVSTTSSAVDAMSSQVSNHIQVAVRSCPISTIGSAVDTMSSQVSNHTQVAVPSCLISICRVALSRTGLRIPRSNATSQTNTQQRRMTLPRQVACTPIAPTLTRTQCASHTEVVHVVGCGVEEVGEEGGSTNSKSKVASSCVTRHVLHHLTH